MSATTPALTESPPPPSSTPDNRPVDPNLKPVSLSHPSAGAKEALTLCGVTSRPELISGMAYLEDARDVVKYVPFVVVEESDLNEGHPIWIISIKGEVQLRSGKVLDPTCIEWQGVQSWYVTGGAWDRYDAFFTAPPVPNPPTLRLPPLRP
jgi:hypothetical protein